MTTIHPSPANAILERASTTPDPREPATTGGAWRAAFEQAGGEQFGGWFQAPTEQPDAGRSPGAAALPAGRTKPDGLPAAGLAHAGAASGAEGAAGSTGSASLRHGAKTPAAPAAASACANPRESAAAAASAQPTSTTVAAPTDGVAPAAIPPSTVAQLATALQSWFQVEVTPVADAAQAGASGPAASVGGVLANSGRVAAGAPDDADTLLADAEAPTPSERGAGAKSELSPLRLHAEWTDEGVRVWVGADAHELPDVAALSTQLQRWLAGQGLSLLGLVCNGRDLLRDAAPRPVSAEPRAPQRARSPLQPFDFSNLYSSQTR